MRIDRLPAIADAIESRPELYTQTSWGEPWCGTPGCIAGYAVTLYVYDQVDNPDPSMDEADAALGLSAAQANRLFDVYWPVSWLPDHLGPSHLGPDHLGVESLPVFLPSAKDAVRVLHKLAAGEIEL